MTTPHIDSVLYDLSDDQIQSLEDHFKAAGYDEAPRVIINQWNAWSMTVSGLLKSLAEEKEEN